jgi:hypothetical protein
MTPFDFNKDLRNEVRNIIANFNTEDAIDATMGIIYQTLIEENPDKRNFYIEASTEHGNDAN